MSTERLWKVLAEDGSAHFGGSGKWNLPKDGKPGRWRTVKGPLVACQNGLHLCRSADLVHWLGPAIFEAEYSGERVDVNDSDPKVVVRKARLLRRVDAWNERAARLFAVECAERALPIFERGRPNDARPREALVVARRYANGEATAEQLAAARDAACAAAWDAAWAAAGAAAGAAAWDAARDAAWAAAWAATWAAARDATWAAARAAARDAARDATWDATWDAARDAERSWQTERLLSLLGVQS